MIGAEIMNDVYKESFVNCKEKRVYLPSCMRKDKETCKAIKINEGFKCMKCNKRCSVRTITLIGESKGFDSRIIPHQTSLFDIRGKNEIGVVSIACILNLLAWWMESNKNGIYTTMCSFRVLWMCSSLV